MNRFLTPLFCVLVFSPLAGAEEITPIGNLSPGLTVSIQGEVTRILDEDEFRIEDDTGSVKVYIGWKNRVTVPVGETITVRGFVDDDLQARFRPELYASEIVRSDGSIITLNVDRSSSSPQAHSPSAPAAEAVVTAEPSEAETTVAPTEDITPIGDLSRGMNAVIRGNVTRILDEDEFRIEDETGSVRVYIGWQNRVRVRVGEEILVRGFVDNDLASFFRPELYANEIVRQDGTVIRLD